MLAIVKLVWLVAAILLGLFCLLTAILLYPDEDDKIQSKLEEVWVRVDDFRKLALTRHAAFLTGIARLETRLFERIFGYELISPQALGMSFCCSFAPIALLCFLGAIADGTGRRIVFTLALFLCCVASGVFSFFLRERRLRLTLSLTVLFSLVIFLLAAFVNSERGYADPTSAPEWAAAALVVAVIGSFAFDIGFIVATRKLLRWAGDMESSARVILIVFINFLLAVGFIGIGPILIKVTGGDFDINSHTLFSVGVPLFISYSNLSDVMISLLFGLLVIMLLIHRAVWPLLNRTIFRFQAIGPKGRRVLLASIGLGLFSCSGIPIPETIKAVIEGLF